MKPVVDAAYAFVLCQRSGTALEACFRRDMLIEAVDTMVESMYLAKNAIDEISVTKKKETTG
jgi:hypothetical protein